MFVYNLLEIFVKELTRFILFSFNLLAAVEINIILPTIPLEKTNYRKFLI